MAGVLLFIVCSANIPPGRDKSQANAHLNVVSRTRCRTWIPRQKRRKIEEQRNDDLVNFGAGRMRGAARAFSGRRRTLPIARVH
ncbi:MAG TPA: hypothetical protein P5534_16725, partial [Candidatus Paceibacterota bacterium]|nr:hypothetical protein [Candidatus Paceibacterota bacterium]